VAARKAPNTGKTFHELFAQVSREQNNAVEAETRRLKQQIVDERPAADRQQRLRRSLRESAQARAQTAD
jgi:hypothetical protein